VRRRGGLDVEAQKNTQKSPMNKKRNKKGDVKTDIALNYIQFPTKESYTPL